MKKESEKQNRGFTLIELLVVVAIIGILSTVVIASLNGARDKGKVAFVKSTLKNIQNQAEITYNETGSYASLFDGSYNCIGSLSTMAQSLTDKGFTVKCYSRNDSSRNDVYLRFGATAIIYDINEIKAWSTDQNGVSKWDTKGVNSSGDFVSGNDTYMDWNTATSACAKYGGRLPSVEEMKTLSDSYYKASGNDSYVPSSIVATGINYWTNTIDMADNTKAYIVGITNTYNGIITAAKTATFYVRCVR